MPESSVYDKLARYCAYQERCPADVRTNLYSLKISPNDFEAFLARLKKENFVNEERYVKAFVAAHWRKKWGKTKIKSALLGKKIDASLIAKYLDQIGNEGYRDQIKVLAQKKGKTLHDGSEREKKNKLIRYLLGKGFEMGAIQEVLKN